MSANRARAIFIELVTQVPPEQWDARLAELAGDDPELRDKVAGLLAAHRQADSFLERPAGPLGGTVDELPSAGAPLDLRSAGGTLAEGPGAVLGGRYQLLEVIGEGGMGTVYRAEQTAPVKRPVALKIIKPGMDSRQVIARFEAERQALALMDHPHIARVFDAGTTDSGRPYFVMELVQGVPITQYCDEQHLKPQQRLELFLPVCQAIQHAHQKGIIHRDIKPSNVLVALYDDQPVPKVIDFGIAKATGPQLTERTLETGLGTVVGTLEYMSPEQAGLDQLDIDTRSDVYSLGVLLYELLTGSTPLEKKRLKAAAILEVLRLIREEEPPRPSTRLSSTDELPSVAAKRGLEPKKLNGVVRGELDWIVMKALEKDRNRRYETANGFAMDVQRYLNDEPVQACPPSAWYRWRKFTRRNKTALATSGLILFFLALLGGGYGWEAREQAAQQRETERGATAALAQGEFLLAEGDKEIDNPARWQATVRLAESAVHRAEEMLAIGRPTADLAERVRQLRAAVATAQTDSKLLAELERIALEQAAVKDGHFDLARTAPRYAAVLQAYGLDVTAAEAAADRVRHSRLREALLSALEDWWCVTTDAGEKRQLAAVLQAAEPAPDAFRVRWREVVRRGDQATLMQMALESGVQDLPPMAVVNLASNLSRAKEYAAAERLLRAAQERHRGNFWLNHNLGMVLLHQKPARPEEAVPYLTAALALRSDSPGVYVNLGLALHDNKDLEGAIREFRAVLKIDPNYAKAHNNLGVALRDNKNLEGAIREFEAALKIDPNYALAHNNLGNALRENKDLEGAIREYQAALKIDSNNAIAHNNLGLALRDNKNLEGAIREFQAALKIDPNFAIAHNNLGLALRDKKDLEGAIREFEAAFKIDPNDADAHNNLGVALHDKNDLEGAIREYQAALKIDPNYAKAHNNLGLALYDKKDLEGAIREFEAALKIDPNYAKAHINLGVALRDNKNLEGAIREFEAALKIDSNNAIAHNNLGLALRAKKDLEGAIREYQAALKIDPNFAIAHYNLGNALRDNKNLEGAIREYQAALKIDPNFADAHNNLGVALYDKNDLEGAIREFEAALKSDPNHAKAHYHLGLALRGKNDLEGAIREYQAALKSDPNYAMAHYNLGNALRSKKDLEGAIREFQAALKIDPNLAQAHCNLGHVLRARGEFRQALEELRRGHELGSGDSSWRYPSARWVKDCERLVMLDEQLPSFLVGTTTPASAAEKIELAQLCTRKHLYRAAVRFYEEAFAAEPELANDRSASRRYNAACAATRAAAGQGKEADKLDDREQTRLRAQALGWLQADLAWRGKQLASQPADRAVVQARLRNWQTDTDLASVRDRAALARLPDAERQRWQTLWSEVADTLAQTPDKEKSPQE